MCIPGSQQSIDPIHGQKQAADADLDLQSSPAEKSNASSQYSSTLKQNQFLTSHNLREIETPERKISFKPVTFSQRIHDVDEKYSLQGKFGYELIEMPRELSAHTSSPPVQQTVPRIGYPLDEELTDHETTFSSPGATLCTPKPKFLSTNFQQTLMIQAVRQL